jgi:hypothetical protein
MACLDSKARHLQDILPEIASKIPKLAGQGNEVADY